MAASDLEKIPGTERKPPAGATLEPIKSDDDIALTAWLRPKHGGEIDIERALQLGATMPKERALEDRAHLAERTAADPDDIEALRAYCAEFGLQVDAPKWRSAVIRGSLFNAKKAFAADVRIATVSDGHTRKRFRTRVGCLSAPKHLVPILIGISGFDDRPRGKREYPHAPKAEPIGAREAATRYAFPDATGRGQVIAIAQFEAKFSESDFDACMTAQGVKTRPPSIQRLDDAYVGHTSTTAKDLEAAMDAQIIAALAPDSTIIIYDAPDTERGYLDLFRAAIFDQEHRPTILSASYGSIESSWSPYALRLFDEMFAAAALIGMSVFCSSGDSGTDPDENGKPQVYAPASSLFVHACGASTIEPGSAAEAAWQCTGGGFSAVNPVPSWQHTVASVAKEYGLSAGRGVPDVCGQVVPGYLVYINGQEIGAGGTSTIAPLWSALTARINERIGAPIGLFAPLLYKNAADGILRDVTTGGNDRFRARKGWDPCTGLGTPVGAALEKLFNGS